METRKGGDTDIAMKLEGIRLGLNCIYSVTAIDAVEAMWLVDYNDGTKNQAEDEENLKKKLKYDLEYAQKLLEEIKELNVQSPKLEAIARILKNKIAFFQQNSDPEKLRKLFYQIRCVYTSDGKFDGIQKYKKERCKGNFICPQGKIITNKAFSTLIYFDSITFEEEAIEKGVKIRLPENIKKLYIVYGDETKAVDISEIGSPAELVRKKGKICIGNDRQHIIVSKTN